MNRRASEVLERYRAAESLGDADRARLLAAVHLRIAGGGAPGPNDGGAAASGTNATGAAKAAGSTLAKLAAVAPKLLLGAALVGVPAAGLGSYVVASHFAAERAATNVAQSKAKLAPVLATAAPPPAPGATTSRAPATPTTNSAPTTNGAPTTNNAPATDLAAPDAVGIDSIPTAAPPSSGPHVVTLRRAAPSRPLANAPVPSNAAAPALAPASAPEPTTTAVAPANAPLQGVDEEVRVVGLAYSLLHSGDAAGALRALDDHDRRFPAGTLAESARVTRVLALCQLGRASEAHAERDRFLARYPASPYANRVKAACPDTAP